MNIKELINYYRLQGNGEANARNLAAQNILIKKIAYSPLSENITLKGGIVMFNLSKTNRRVTQDIDFDFIRYSISPESIKLFVRKLNATHDGIMVKINGEIEPLHQEDYKGARVHLLMTDKSGGKLTIKLDLGVHTYSAIEQEKVLFSFNEDEEKVLINVNPCEQIFAEKILSLAHLNILSTRYKDVFDLYYLIKEKLVNPQITSNTIILYFENSKRKPDNYNDLVLSIEETLNNELFISNIKRSNANWLDEDYDVIKTTIIDFIKRL